MLCLVGLMHRQSPQEGGRGVRARVRGGCDEAERGALWLPGSEGGGRGSEPSSAASFKQGQAPSRAPRRNTALPTPEFSPARPTLDF